MMFIRKFINLTKFAPCILAGALVGCNSGSSDGGSLGNIALTIEPSQFAVESTAKVTATLSGARNGSSDLGSAIVTFATTNSSIAALSNNANSINFESSLTCMIIKPTAANASCSVYLTGIAPGTGYVSASAINSARTASTLNADAITGFTVTTNNNMLGLTAN